MCATDAAFLIRRSVFVDEAGNLDFSARGSRYFVLGSVTLDSCAVGAELLSLRRELATRGRDLPLGFHASEDKQYVRDAVFSVLNRYAFRFDATIFEKAKVEPHLRQNAIDFYNFTWYYHARHLMPSICLTCDELFVAAASINLKWRREQATAAIGTAIANTVGDTPFTAVAWECSTDPCLQVADYCCWALQRKLERNDERSYVLIKDKIVTEFDFFRLNDEVFY